MSSNKKNSFKKRYTKKSDNRSRKKYDRNNRSSGYMVRISNLPHDVTDHELKELVKFDYTDNNGKTIRCNWHILKCFIMNKYILIFIESLFPIFAIIIWKKDSPIQNTSEEKGNSLLSVDIKVVT